MAHYPPRPRPKGKPKSPKQIIMRDFPGISEERAEDISHTIHRRLREQAERTAK